MLVGEIYPNIFALGAATGKDKFSKTFRVIFFLGTLKATEVKLEVVISGIKLFFSKIIVSGPGQNFSANI